MVPAIVPVVPIIVSVVPVIVSVVPIIVSVVPVVVSVVPVIVSVVPVVPVVPVVSFRLFRSGVPGFITCHGTQHGQITWSRYAARSYNMVTVRSTVI